MFIVHTDSATCFAVSDTAQGHGHRRLYGPGPHLLQSDVWAQPGGPRGTSDIRKLAAGSVIIRICAGDEYTCAQWRVTTPD